MKNVVYGATAKDAELIGFRDDFIYRFIETKCSNDEILKVEFAGPEDRANIKMLYENYKLNQKEIY